MSVTDETVTVVLAAERGEVLAPLTRNRSKPAIPFGGEYRLVDFPLSNCLHSGLRRVLVLTQYNSHSLHKHLRDGWGIYNPDLGEYVTSVPPQGRDGSTSYRGSADALHQSAFLLERSGAAHVLVLPGDHVYRMDYAALLEAHAESGQDVTIVCADTAPGPGSYPLARVGASGEILALDGDAVAAEDGAITRVPMGIYAFRAERLLPLLHDHTGRGQLDWDLGRDVLPRLVEDGRAVAYRFGAAAGRVSQDRYWSDVRDLDAYFRAQMALLEPVPPLDLYQENWSIWSHAGKNPPARTVSSPSGNEGIFVSSIVSNGAVNVGAAVSNAVICPCVRVADGATVERSILLDGVQVGRRARLRNCIVDKHVSIPDGAEIGFDAAADGERYVLTQGGVVVVPGR